MLPLIFKSASTYNSNHLGLSRLCSYFLFLCIKIILFYIIGKVFECLSFPLFCIRNDYPVSVTLAQRAPAWVIVGDGPWFYGSSTLSAETPSSVRHCFLLHPSDLSIHMPSICLFCRGYVTIHYSWIAKGSDELPARHLSKPRDPPSSSRKLDQRNPMETWRSTWKVCCYQQVSKLHRLRWSKGYTDL